jgi:3,4-dihydroxy-9,10-secoandrosta-1,3,5(10)-triene-9,17-dione 4,5-dioxygenase
VELHGLGYVGFTSPDPAAWLSFGTEVLGMMPARAVPGEKPGAPPALGIGVESKGSGVGPDGSIYLKMDERQWRIGIHPGEPSLAYLGFELTDEVALEEALVEIEARGVLVTRGTPEEASARGVEGLIWCTDPPGNRIELFYRPVYDQHFVSPHGVRFLTGDLGLGHVLLMVADMEPSLGFYRGALGFKRSDYISAGRGRSLQFLRCTRRHHSIGLVHVAPIDGVHHLMVEASCLDDVGAAFDRAVDAGREITKTVGRHLNDQMVSFYMRSPNGYEVEFGFDGVLVDDATWCDREVTGGDPWGHHGMNVKESEEFREGARA